MQFRFDNIILEPFVLLQKCAMLMML